MNKNNYDRIQKKRKEYIYQSRLFSTGVYVKHAKHNSCAGTLEGAISRIGFSNSRSYSVKR